MNKKTQQRSFRTKNKSYRKNNISYRKKNKSYRRKSKFIKGGDIPVSYTTIPLNADGTGLTTDQNPIMKNVNEVYQLDSNNLPIIEFNEQEPNIIMIRATSTDESYKLIPVPKTKKIFFHNNQPMTVGCLFGMASKDIKEFWPDEYNTLINEDCSS